jgi:hypothetical protein
VLVLWTLPIGVLGAAAGQRLAKDQKAANAITLEDHQRRGWS